MKPRHRVLGRARELVLTPQQRDKLLEYTKGRGGYQSLCGRVYNSIKTKNGELVATVYEEDMVRVLGAAARGDDGGWEALFRDIMAANPYQECFGQAFNLDWSDCTADFAILEQIVLARNDGQHPSKITFMHVSHSKKTQGKFPQLFFVRDNDETAAADAVGNPSRWWDPTLYVSRENLFRAIEEVEKLVDWLDDRLLEAKYG